MLAGQRFLHGMRADQLDALAATASEVMFPAGHRIFADGGYVGSFWLIESGYVALDVQVPGEGPEIIGTVGIGEILGWSWLVPPYQWAFGAVCVTRVRAIEFSAPCRPGPLRGRSGPRARAHPAAVPGARGAAGGDQGPADRQVGGDELVKHGPRRGEGDPADSPRPR